ncbi:hypothetical protein BH09PAT4_BH09PAT4_01500 [soil metagenome]
MKHLFHRRKTIQSQKKSHVERLRVVSKHPIMVPVMVFATLALLSCIGYFVFLYNPGKPIAPNSAFVVIVSHDKTVQTVPSRKQTVGQLLKNLSITLNKGDVVEPELTTPITQDDFRINVYRAVPVQVIEGNQRTFAFSAATTPRSVASQVGYTLYPEDGVKAVPVTNFLKQGSIAEQVLIDPSVPVYLNLYGTPLQIRTHANTVQELLKEKGLSLAASDQVLPKPDTPITANLQVFVARKGTTLQSLVEPVAMPIKTVNDGKLAYGIRVVRQQGSPGKRIVTYQVDKKTGLRKIIQRATIVSPVQQVVAIGTNLSGTRGDVLRAGISASDYFYVDYIVSHEGGWSGVTKYNSAGSGAYGLCQALPGSKMASAGSDWRTNPITQLKWCDGYATGRYGSWQSAYYFWVNHRYW